MTREEWCNLANQRLDAIYKLETDLEVERSKSAALRLILKRTVPEVFAAIEMLLDKERA